MTNTKETYWQKPLVKKSGNWLFLIITVMAMAYVISFYTTQNNQLLQINDFTYNVTNSTKPLLREATTPLGEDVLITSFLFSGHFNKTGTTLDFTHAIRTYQLKPKEGYANTWLSWHSKKEELEVLLKNPQVTQSECRIDNGNVKWQIECLYSIESDTPLVTEYLLLRLSNKQKEYIMTDYHKVNLIVDDYLNDKQIFTED